MERILLAKMTWEEVAERIKGGYNIAVVPTGAIEQHGPMLPLDVDIHNCYEIILKTAERVAKDVKPVVVPPIWFGFSWFFMDFPGTITLKEQTFTNVVIEVSKSLIHHGFKKIVIVDGHGGNHGALHEARYRLKAQTDAFVVVVGLSTFVPADLVKELFRPPIHHADEVETAMSLALGNVVHMDRVVDEVPKGPLHKYIKFDYSAPPPKVLYPLRMKEWTKSGSWGYPSRATKEKGEKYVEAIVNGFAEFLRELKALDWKERLGNKYRYFE